MVNLLQLGCIFLELIPNTSDDEGRYSYENQPDIGYFNLDKLRRALAPLINEKRLIYHLSHDWCLVILCIQHGNHFIF
jgi:uncharacterized protein YdiU (UPF0061 family)